MVGREPAHPQHLPRPQREFAIAGGDGGSATVGDGTVSFGAAPSWTPTVILYRRGEPRGLADRRAPGSRLLRRLPGDFEGIREDGSTTQFVSFGFMGVNMYNADKSGRGPSGPRRDRRAEPAGRRIQAGRRPTSMWWFDETTGVWREDGAVEYVGGSFVADVSHFTT
ncbi:MAG: hypothetical protein IPH09_09790 [bacterium]|nr:hypothetical protein [bacterium]